MEKYYLTISWHNSNSIDTYELDKKGIQALDEDNFGDYMKERFGTCVGNHASWYIHTDNYEMMEKRRLTNLNNRLDKEFNRIASSYNLSEEEANCIKSQYDMLFGWWLVDGEDDDFFNHPKIQNLCNAEGVDFFDFLSATFIALTNILKGKREFDFHDVSEYVGDKEMRKRYYKVDGIAIQKHNKVLAAYSLDLIDYMFACIKEVNGVLGFEKVFWGLF